MKLVKQDKCNKKVYCKRKPKETGCLRSNTRVLCTEVSGQEIASKYRKCESNNNNRFVNKCK